jgi:hypothetical protein
MAYNFQTRDNIIKLLMEYESVTQKVVRSSELMLKMLNNFNMRAFHDT